MIASSGTWRVDHAQHGQRGGRCSQPLEHEIRPGSIVENHNHKLGLTRLAHAPAIKALRALRPSSVSETTEDRDISACEALAELRKTSQTSRRSDSILVNRAGALAEYTGYLATRP